MSTRNLDTSWCVGKRLIEVGGSFVPLTGAGTVLASAVRGQGFGYAPSQTTGLNVLKTAAGNNPVPLSTPGIVRSTTGTYTVTFEDPYLDIEYAWAQLAGPTGGVATGGSSLSAVVIEPISNLGVAFTAPTMTITITNNAGTVVEAVGSLRCHFGIIFRDSTVLFHKP